VVFFVGIDGVDPQLMSSFVLLMWDTHAKLKRLAMAFTNRVEITVTRGHLIVVTISVCDGLFCSFALMMAAPLIHPSFFALQK
jgi:hypothetical protein